MSNINLVAVYGSLRKKGFLHDHLETSNHVIDCFLPLEYSMHDLGPYPAVTIEANTTGNRVFAEVYEVSDEQLKVLDLVEGHPNFYKRVEVSVEELEGQNVWVYTLSDIPENYKLVESGDWIEYSNRQRA